MPTDNIESLFGRIRQFSEANYESMRQLLESHRKLRTVSLINNFKILVNQINEPA